MEHFAKEVVKPSNHLVKSAPDTLQHCPPSDSLPPDCALSNARYHQAAAAAPWASVTAWAGLGQAILSICGYIYISTEHHHSSIGPGTEELCYWVRGNVRSSSLSRDAAAGGIVGVGVPSNPELVIRLRISTV